MEITAKFIGRNMSLGYVKNKTYTLKLNNYGGMSISLLDGGAKCTYTSISAFLKNWSNITLNI